MKGLIHMKLMTVEEMREIEQRANEIDISNEQMMLKAGTGLANLIEKRFADSCDHTVIGLVGKGNNGGDTLVALNLLKKNGWNAIVVLASLRPSDALLETFIRVGGQVITFGEEKFNSQVKEILTPNSLILDGFLGTGIKLPLKPEASQFLAIINKLITKQIVIAVDCPSGVDCNSGETAPETIAATLTVCFEAVKVGLIKEPAFAYCGSFEVVPLGLPKSLASINNEKMLIDAQWAAEHLTKRSAFSHKGTFGKVMIAGGSINYLGAPQLAGLAAYRLGSGLVTLAVTHSVASVIAGSVPEITWVILDEEGGVISETASELLLRELVNYDAAALGPGIGQEETTQRFLQRILFQPQKNNHRKVGFLEDDIASLPAVKLPPLVLDADALRWLARQKNWFEAIQLKIVLTPHPGEMSALTGISIAEIQSDRLGCASKYARQWQQVVVLKGAISVVAAPDGRICVIPIASSALAKAGSGDVLTGMITSLIGQGLPLFEAAALAAWIHGKAGIEAANDIGNEASVLARDIIAAIPSIFKFIK